MMSIILLLGIVVVVLIVAGIVWAVREDSKEEEKKTPELVQKQAQEKQEHLQKVLSLIATRDRIANNDVEKLLGVSNATAERYLNELEQKGVLKQVGNIGQGVYYKKTE